MIFGSRILRRKSARLCCTSKTLTAELFFIDPIKIDILCLQKYLGGGRKRACQEKWFDAVKVRDELGGCLSVPRPTSH